MKVEHLALPSQKARVALGTLASGEATQPQGRFVPAPSPLTETMSTRVAPEDVLHLVQDSCVAEPKLVLPHSDNDAHWVEHFTPAHQQITEHSITTKKQKASGPG